MLAPMKPSSDGKTAAGYEKALENYEADKRSMIEQPHNWGVKDKPIVKTVVMNKGSDAETAAMLSLEKKKSADLEKQLNSERGSALVESELDKLGEDELKNFSKKRLEDYARFRFNKELDLRKGFKNLLEEVLSW